MSVDLTKALESNQEFDWLDFKRSFDVSSAGEWCEIIKDIIAMANSGGGVIIIGLENEGRPSNFDVSPVLGLDPANVTNKVYKYTDFQFSDFEIIPVEKDGAKLAAIVIEGAHIPIVFTNPWAGTDAPWLPPFILHGERLHTFFDLREEANPLRQLVDVEEVRMNRLYYETASNNRERLRFRASR